MSIDGEVGRGAMAVALGQARAESGLPITMEQAVRRSVGFNQSILDPYAVRSLGAAEAWLQATRVYADQMRGVAADMGTNLTEIGAGYRRLQEQFSVNGSDLASRASRLGDSIGLSSDTSRDLYAMVFTGELLYKSGALGGALDALEGAAAPLVQGMKELGSDFLAALGITGGTAVSSAACSAALSAVSSTITQMWNVWQVQTYQKPPSIPPAEYWGKIVCALYGGWDPLPSNPASGSDFGFAGTAAYPINPSWRGLADYYFPVLDPILREYRVLETGSDKSIRVLDKWSRETLRHQRVKRWLKVENASGVKGINVVRRRSLETTGTAGFVSGYTEGDLVEQDMVGTLDDCSGTMLDPSSWRPVEAHRMSGVEATWRCATCSKHSHWCDGSSRNNNICHRTSADFQFWYAVDRTYLFGGYVAAAYLGANIMGAQNFGMWESPDCGYGEGTYVPGEYWDLGIGGGRRADGSAYCNWFAMILRTGQVLLRPPQRFATEGSLATSMGDGARQQMVRDQPGPWYPMFPMTTEDRAEGKFVASGLNSKLSDGPIPTTVENGIAQRSPMVPARFQAVDFSSSGLRPPPRSTYEKKGLSTGTKVAVGVGAVAAGVGIAKLLKLF